MTPPGDQEFSGSIRISWIFPSAVRTAIKIGRQQTSQSWTHVVSSCPRSNEKELRPAQ